MYGYRADEIIGRHFSCFYLPDDVRRGRPQHELEVATIEGHFVHDGWRIRKDGSRFLAHASITPLRNEFGDLRGFAKITHCHHRAKEYRQRKGSMMSDERPYQSLCGWRGIDATQKVFASQFSPLRQAAPHLFGAPPPTDPVLLYKAWSDVLGKYPDYPAQQIGDCVSFGHGHGNDLLQCIEIGLGEPVEYRETDTEFIYAASREVAGILGTRTTDLMGRRRSRR